MRKYFSLAMLAGAMVGCGESTTDDPIVERREPTIGTREPRPVVALVTIKVPGMT